MKRKSIFALVFGFGLVAITALATLASCEVGLGSAVDVLTPELAITYPATGTIVKGKFALSGTCSDDGQIDHITITVRATEDSGTGITRVYPVEYIDEVNHKWLCVIDPADAKNALIDGNYEATVEIADKANHKNSKSRSFTIDNTAPVIAITRPSAIDPQDPASTDYDSYGQDFIISGHVGDACDSKYMSVTIYDMEGNKKYTTPSKIKIDSDFSITLASYGAEPGSSEKTAYEAIYGTDKEAGTKRFLCAITGSDSAEEVPIDGSAPTEANKTGNTTTFFYMYEGDLYNDVFYPYGTSNAYKILSGTFGDSEARAVGSVEKTAAQVKELLNSQAYQISKGFFSLNPRNNPSFIVSGRDPLKLDGGDFTDNSDYEVSDGSKIVVEINPGLDGTPISEETLGLYVIECDKDGKAKSGAEKITLIPQYKSNAGEVLLDDADVIANRKSCISKSGSVYKLTSIISLKTTPQLKADTSYLVGLFGCDSKKIEIKNLDTAYGFKLVPVGSAPTLTIQEPEGSLIYKNTNSKITIKGYTEVNSAIPSIKIELITRDAENNEIATTLKEYKKPADYIAQEGGEANIRQPGATTKGRGSFKFEIDTKDGEFKDLFDKTLSSQYDIKITTEAGGNTADATKTIMYDVADPNIVFLSEPKFYKYEGEDNTVETYGENDYGYINGTIKFRVSMSDAYTAVNTTAPVNEGDPDTPKVEFIQNDVIKASFTAFTSPAGQDFELDTTTLDAGLVEIKLTCSDLAGNEATKSIYRYVDQDTDIPVIQGTNNSTIGYASKQDLTDGKDAGSAKNIIVANSNYILNFIDDDGIKSLKKKEIQVSSSDDEAAKKTELNNREWQNVDISSGTIVQFSESLSDAGKYYFFKFLITDINDLEKEYGPIVVLVSAQNPELNASGDKFATTNSANLAPDAKKTISTTLDIGSVSEPFTVYRQVVGVGEEPSSDSDWELVVDNLHTTDYVDVYTPTQAPGQYDICYKVKDDNNHFSSIKRNSNVTIDNTRPTMLITEPANNTVKTGEDAISETNYRFKGEFTETNLDTFWYQITSSSTAPQVPTSGTWEASNWKKGVSSENSNWEFAAAFVKGTDEGRKYLHICAVDKAGNVSDVVSRTFDIDMTYPEITTKIDGEETKSTATISKTAAYEFKFKAEDTNGTSIISPTITVKKDDVALTTTSHATNPYYTVSTADSDSFKTITISNSSDGIFEYAISATDAVGKTTTVERTINLDTKAPELTTISPDLNEYQPSTTVNVSGTAQDQTGILAVWYAYNKAEPSKPTTAEAAKVDTSWTGAGWTKATGTTNWKINGLTGVDGTPRKLYICLVDKNGLITDLGEKTVKVDTANPTLTETTINKTGVVYKNAGNSGNSGFTLSGKAEDANGIKEVKIEYTKNGGEKQTTTVQPNASTHVWTYTVAYAAAGANDGDYEYTITAIDNADKPSTQIQRHVIYDTVAPKAMHYKDNSGKDIYFRFGDADNTLSELETWQNTITSLNSALDYDVGGKYKFGSWGNDISIKIRGLFEETGSGVETIYYAVCANESAVSQFVANPDTYKTGTFAPLAANETKRVKKNNASGYEFVEIESSYKTIISTGLVPNKSNILVLVAKDKAGNTAPDTMVLYDGTTTGDASWNGNGKNYYSINIDNKKPTVTSNFAETTLYTNGNNTITIDGIAEDAAASGEVSAGLKSFSLEVNDATIDSSYITITKTGSATALDETTTYTGLGSKKWYWKALIPGSVVKGSATSGNVTIKAKIVDDAGAGNIATPDVAVVTIDTKAPEVEITPPQDADTSAADIQVNKTFTLEGKASDSNGLKEDTDSDKNLKLYYTTNATVGNLNAAPSTITPNTNAANGWKAFATAKHDTNWSFSVDTTTIQSGTTATTAYFIVEAKDKAGNTGYSKPQKLVINQNTDRPIIKFTNITESNGSYFLKFGNQSQLEGNVSDDDKASAEVVDTFIVSSSAITTAPTNDSGGWTKTTDNTKGTTTWTHATYGITTITNSSGDYTYTPADTGDGLKEVYFFVKDKGGTSFYTAASQLNQPYQQYKTNDKTGNTAMISYKSDSTSPTIDSVKILISDTWGNVKTEENASSTYFTNTMCTVHPVSTADATEQNPATQDNVTVYKQIDTGTSTVVGGTKIETIRFHISAHDANGIDDMNLVYTPFEESGTQITKSSGDFENVGTSAIWVTDEISVTGFNTGSVNVAVTAYDNCGLFANQNPVFMVDNDGPAINISSPAANEEVSGDVSIAGQATDTGGAGSPTIHFLIPTTAQKTAAGNTDAAQIAYYKALTTMGEGGWIGKIHGDKTPSSFEYVFNGGANDNASLDIYTKSDNSNTYPYTADPDGIYSVPIFFRSEDALGNVNVIKFTTKYNPDADKPKTEINYPSSANYGEGVDYVTLGGLIRVTGSVTIPSLQTTPDRVYIQISDENGNFNDTDKAKAGTGSGNYGYTVKNIANVSSDIGKPVIGLSNDASSAWWGIEAVRSSNAWSFNLNANGKMNVTTGTKINSIKIRACGVNAVGKMGAWSEPVSIHIDASAPEYTTKLYQFGSAPTALSHTPTAERDYEPGVYLSGDWYLGLHMTDEDSIVVDTVERDGATIAASDYIPLFTNSNKTLDLYIKLTSAATQTYKISVRDNAEGNYHYVYPTYDIKVDNTPPTLSEIKTGDGNEIEMTKQRTSDKLLTFGATATDEGSGFSRLAYYFKRVSDNKIEVPVPAAENTGWKPGTAYSGELTKTEDHLYGVELTGTGALSGENTTFTITDGIGSNTFIRKYGIVKLAGTYHLITDVNGSVVTVSGNINSVVGNNKKAFFPAAFVVDNTSAESPSPSGSGYVITGDDGDGIIESVRKAGTTWTWDTSVYAGELDDGQVTLYTVAFDQAGNCDVESSSFMIANKTPRLSKLYLATDLNGNGKYSDDELGTSIIAESEGNTEYKWYSALDSNRVQEVFTVNGKKDADSNLEDDSGITMRDKLGIAFEFIGNNENYGSGQGDLKYILSVAGTKLDDTTGGETGTPVTLPTATDSNYDNTNNTTTKGLIGKKFLEITPAMFWNGTAPVTTYGTYTEDDKNYLRVTIWDSANDAPGTKDVIGEDGKYTSFGAQWTAFNIPLKMDLIDGVAPTVSIDDPVALGTEDVPDGHVDLKSTLTAIGSNEYDTDDKVSGKIKFTGTINDDKRISYINLTVSENFSSQAVSGVRLVTYNPSTGGFKVGTNGAAVTIGGNSPTEIVPNNATGLKFKLLTNEFSTKNGHTVTWELEVDSELVAGTAATDVVFTVTANDGTTANTKNTNRQVDIVPYITSLKRSTTLTDTHRSRLGKYQVVLGENIDVTGFNFPSTAQTVANAVKLQVSGQEKLANGTVKTSITPANGYTVHSMKFAAPGTSGYIKVVTNGVSSTNNFNSGNEMEGDYDSDTWNDNIYLNVWKNNEYFYFSNDPISPAMDRIPNGEGQFRLYGGWATQGSKFYASYANTTGSGSSGNAPSPASGNSETSASSQSFGDPATFYDVIIDSSGNRYNILLDCWQGGNGCHWGQNFVINKNGIYNHNGAGSAAWQNSNSGNARRIIERMGNEDNPDSANSTDGCDSVFNQFLNPRIALDTANEIAYLTYYDRYAKCLKYAVMKPSTEQGTMEFKIATEGIYTDSTYDNTANGINGNGGLSKNYTNGACVVAGYDTTVTGGSKTNLDVGVWSAVAIDPVSKAPVVAYYDSTNKRLMLATGSGDGASFTGHTTTASITSYPVNSNSPVLTGTATSTTQGNAWNRQEVKKTDADSLLRLGQYVSMVTDAGGNLHIACNGAKGGNKLYYIYGERTAYGSYTFDAPVCVDAEGAGTWTDIQLEAPTQTGASAKPVISYYDPSNDSSENAVKVAYLDDGVWDTMTAPLASSAVSNRITLALDITDGATYTADGTTNNSKLAVGYVSSRFDCVYLRKE